MTDLVRCTSPSNTAAYDLLLQRRRKRCRADADDEAQCSAKIQKFSPAVIKKRPTTPPRWEGEKKKKLVLVLDLEHTLLHSIPAPDDNNNNKERIRRTDDPSDLYRWDVSAVESTITKLRPYARAFLNEASALFDLYIYTMGCRLYARGIAKILDPDGTYFSPVRSKVISREDCTRYGKKDLHVVPRDSRFAVIVDDTEEVWADNCRDNLIRIQKYEYCSRGRRSTSGKDDDGALAIILDVLRSVHASFYGHPPSDATRDVRMVLNEMRMQVLKGCKIVFSWVLASKSVKPVWKMAEKLGATCSMNQDGDALVTHVISTSNRSDAAQWALRSGRFLVTLAWVEASYYTWCREQEAAFQPPIGK